MPLGTWQKPCAGILDQANRFVQLSVEVDAIALIRDQLAPDLEQNLTDVFTDNRRGAYLISAYSYLLTGESHVERAKGALLGPFVSARLHPFR
jgi:hypothetical protein